MAQKWVSFEEVKSQVSIRDVLAHYALMQGTVEKPSKHGLELRLRCPFHEGPPGAMSRFFTVSRKTLSLPKSTRCHIRPKNNVLRRNPLDIARMVRAHVPPSRP